MTKELKQEFERIIREQDFSIYDCDYEDAMRLMEIAHALGQSSLKSRVEELEETLKTSTTELEMYIPMTDVKVLDKCYAALRNKAK